jgi:outer membrane protein OmpA-like peptidoglycan-associated protein
MPQSIETKDVGSILKIGQRRAVTTSETIAARANNKEPGGKIKRFERMPFMSTLRMQALQVSVLAAAVATLSGCATKNYVRNQTAPIVNQENELNDKTAANNRAIKDTDERAQAGITKAQGSADNATQNAQGAQKAAGDAETAANDAVHRADSLASVVSGLDNYSPIGDVAVTFGFDKSVLSKDDKAQLDSFAANLTNAKSYILEVTGGTDSTGSADYNYALSQRRADAVVQYLASKYDIPARRFYLIGIGKDKEVADNTTREGRAKNRRVEVRLLSNMKQPETGTSNPAPTGN